MADKLPVVINSKVSDDKDKKGYLPPEEMIPDRWLAAYAEYSQEVSTKQKSDTGAYEKEVLRISEYPEFKRTTVKKCKKVFGRKVCINWPQLWKRTGRLSVYIVITYPQEFDKDVKECFSTALSGAVLALLGSGSFHGAWEVFLSLLEACLTAKGLEAIGKIGGKFELRTTHTAWRKV